MSNINVLILYKGDTSGIDKAHKEAEEKVKNSASKLDAIAKKASSAIGKAFIAAGADVLKFGMEFESSVTKVSTLFGDVAVDTNNLNKKILELSNASGIAASDLANNLYKALSAGIPVTEDMGEAMAFLESNTKLAKASFIDVDTAVTTTSEILKDYGMKVSETDKIHKILMQTQNKGKTTIAELTSVLADVTPTAAAMGVSFEQVGAALANMTAKGIPASQATTQLNHLIEELGESGTKASDALMEATKGTEHAGKSFVELQKEGVPLNEILDLIDKSAKENGLSMLDMFSSIEAGEAALAIAGENSQKFTENLKAMSTETDVVGEAFNKVSGTTAERFGKMMNELKNAAIGLFFELMPLIEDLLPILQELLEKLLPPITELVKKLMPVITTLLDIIMALLMPIIDYLIELLVPITDVVMALLPLLEILGLISNVISKLMVEALKPLQEMFTEVFKGIANTITEQVQIIKNIFEEIINFVKNVFTGNWQGAWESVKLIFLNVWEWIKNGAKLPINSIIDGLNSLLSGLNKIKVPDWVPVFGGKGINIPLIPRLKKGADFIPKDFYPAFLDYGERVLTQQQNIRFNEMGGLEGMERALSASVNTQSSQLITLHNVLRGDIEMDGFKVGTVIMRNIDDVKKYA